MLQILEHPVFEVKRDHFIHIIRMNIDLDGPSAVRKEIIARRGNIQLLILVGRRDLRISVCLKIDVIKRIVLRRKTRCDLVIDLLLARSLLLFLTAAVFRIDIDDAEDDVITGIFKSADNAQRVPYRSSVDHQAVFDAVHGAFFDFGQKVLLLEAFEEKVLILFINNLLAVFFNILEKIIASGFQVQRVEFGINSIPAVFVGDSIDIINTGVINQQ